jgi:hypothetical protein
MNTFPGVHKGVCIKKDLAEESLASRPLFIT